MRKINLLNLLFVLYALIIFFTACEKDDPKPEKNINPSDTTTVHGPYCNGIFITNEGTYGAGNGSVSFYNSEEDSLYNNIFFSVNGRALGDVVQSITMQDTLAFIVVNASNKVEVVSKDFFTEAGVINNIVTPRYYLAIDSTKGYVSQWGENGAVKVINLSNLTVSNTIFVGTGAEKMLLHNNLVYVANSGGNANNNSISIIDPSIESVVKTIILNGDSPRSFVVDANGDIWVLCAGYVDYTNYPDITETPSKLIRINPSTNEVAETIAISETLHPTCLGISKNGNNLFYGGGYGVQGIYKMSIDDNTAPSNPLIDKSFYGFSINPETGNIYALEAPSYTENGTLWRYAPDGTLLGRYEAGISPNSASFKKK